MILSDASNYQIKKVGFFVKPLTEIIQINNNSRQFNNHQYYTIIISVDALTLKTDLGEVAVNTKSVVYIGPGRIFELLGEVTKETFCIVFRSCFYERTPQDSFLLILNYFSTLIQIFTLFLFAKVASMRKQILLTEWKSSN